MTSAAEDAYAAQYMRPGEAVVWREKVVSRAAFVVSVIFAVAFGGAGLLVAGSVLFGAPAPLLAAAAVLTLFATFMAVAGAAFSVFRTLVTASHLHVHFGWAKRKIPMDAIDDVSAVKLKGFKQGKVSMGFDGVVRTWVGQSASGRGVEIAYRDGKRRHVLTVGTDDAEGFVAAVQAGRATTAAADEAARR